MKILLINPRFPNSLWNFSGLSELTGTSMGQAPLGLATVAALTPEKHQVTIVDENIESIDFDAEVDLVAIGSFNVQFRRAIEISRQFKARGIPAVVGGPYVSLVPEKGDGHFDHVLSGEAEYIWPQFLEDLEAGIAKALYVQKQNIDITHSPIPRFDLLKLESYLWVYMQASRGCPFACEFCDIIITDGRVARVKPVSQVMAEIEAVAALGGRAIAFSDANFIGNHRYAKELLTEMSAWSKARGNTVGFGAEMTLNVAERPDLLQLLRDANFKGIFVGIESPRAASLLETKKVQNTIGDMVEGVKRIQRHNIIVDAGMIVGFDSDDTLIFKEQLDFLTEAGIAFTTCGVLTALERTPLYTRLQKEGRLLDHDYENTIGHGRADLNFEPALMTRDELLDGYNWLIRSLYKYDNYGSRLVDGLARFSPTTSAGQSGWKTFDWRALKILARTLNYYVLRGGTSRRRFFLSALLAGSRSGLSIHKVEGLVSYLIAHKHFHEFVMQTHGDPETVASRPPVAEPAPETPQDPLPMAVYGETPSTLSSGARR